MEPKPRRPRLLGVVGIGVIQAGLSLYFCVKQIIEILKAPEQYYKRALPFDYVSIFVALVAFVALFLIVLRKRIGLELGLGAWTMSSLLTIVGTAFVILLTRVPIGQIFSMIIGVVTLVTNLLIIYILSRYLMQPPDKSVFS
ncbi:MAG: hypothetical protein ABI947_28020 [Chloroflexota bacterium]